MSVECPEGPLQRLVGRLRAAARGRAEWRVQDPETKAYILAYDELDAGEMMARHWLNDHRSRHPDSPKARYEVARAVVLDERDELLLEAAAILESAPAAIMDTRDVLGICAPTEDAFPALYALQGRRVRLVLDEPPNAALSGPHD
jgi:hypothetical protein